jgi:hypothetical protein
MSVTIALAKTQGLAFDNPGDLHCKKHPIQKLSVVSKENNPYHNWTYYFCPDCTLEDLLGSHNHSVESLRGGTSQWFRKGDYLDAKGRLERYINAI